MKYLCFAFIVSVVAADVMFFGTNNFTTTLPEVRLCKSMKLDPDITYHITRFQPVAGSNVHHMMIFGCDEPGTDKLTWNCGDIANVEPGYGIYRHCNNSESYWIYGWAARSSKNILSIPEGYSFQVGKDTGYNHLVFEVHYGLPTVSVDSKESVAGAHLTYDNKPVTDIQLAMLDVKSNEKYPIPAKKTTLVDIVTVVPAVMHPVMFHTHAHDLAKKVSGYLIKRNPQNTGEHTWIKVGIQSPPIPQDNFKVANNMTMKPGDLFALRCTFYNYNDYDMSLGSKETDEMCEFGIIYAYKNGSEHTGFMGGLIGDWKMRGLTNIPIEA